MADKMKIDLKRELVEIYKIPNKDEDLKRYKALGESKGVTNVPEVSYKVFSTNWNKDLNDLSSTFDLKNVDFTPKQKNTAQMVLNMAEAFPAGSFKPGEFGDKLFSDPKWLHQIAYFPNHRPSDGSLSAPDLYQGTVDLSKINYVGPENDFSFYVKALEKKAEEARLNTPEWKGSYKFEGKPFTDFRSESVTPHPAEDHKAEAKKEKSEAQEAEIFAKDPIKVKPEVKNAPEVQSEVVKTKVKDKKTEKIFNDLKVAEDPEVTPQTEAAPVKPIPTDKTDKKEPDTYLPQETVELKPEYIPAVSPRQNVRPKGKPTSLGQVFTPVVNNADLRNYFYAEPMAGTPEFTAIKNSGAPLIINIYNMSRRSVFGMAADAIKALPHVFASSAVTFYRGMTDAMNGHAANKQDLIPQIGFSNQISNALNAIIDRRVDMRMDAISQAINNAISGERAQNSLAAGLNSGMKR